MITRQNLIRTNGQKSCDKINLNLEDNVYNNNNDMPSKKYWIVRCY